MIDKETLDSQINTLRKAVAALTKRQQEAIQLRFYQGFSNDQIAELMEMNYQSVSNLLYSALCRIKKNLKAPVFTTALVAALHLFF
jgi:RNA polymerase sigma factor (sigma-70 family)